MNVDQGEVGLNIYPLTVHEIAVLILYVISYGINLLIN